MSLVRLSLANSQPHAALWWKECLGQVLSCELGWVTPLLWLWTSHWPHRNNMMLGAANFWGYSTIQIKTTCENMSKTGSDCLLELEPGLFSALSFLICKAWTRITQSVPNSFSRRVPGNHSSLCSWPCISSHELQLSTFLGSKITADGDSIQEIKRRLLLGRKAITNLDSVLKSWDITLLTKVCIVKAIVVMYRCESWTIKKAEHQRIDAFKPWCCRRLLRVPWTARRSNQSILKEINLEYSLEGLMLKLKL